MKFSSILLANFFGLLATPATGSNECVAKYKFGTYDGTFMPYDADPFVPCYNDPAGGTISVRPNKDGQNNTIIIIFDDCELLNGPETQGFRCPCNKDDTALENTDEDTGVVLETSCKYSQGIDKDATGPNNVYCPEAIELEKTPFTVFVLAREASGTNGFTCKYKDIPDTGVGQQ